MTKPLTDKIWKTERKSLKDLKPWEQNPRTIDVDGIKNIQASLEEDGDWGIIAVDVDGTIISGNQRYRALIAKGVTEVDVKVSPNKLTEKERRRIALRANRTKGKDDWDVLANWDKEDLLAGWITSKEIDRLLQVEEDEFDVGKVLSKTGPTIAKLGDIWQLGRHRVMCGDSTQPEAVLRLMEGKKADMVFTDPPYGMNLDVKNSDNLGGKGKWRNKAKNYTPVIGDDRDYNPTHLFEMFPNVKEMFLWGFDYFAEFIPNRKEGSVIVWDKRKGVEDMKLTFSEFELCWSREKHLREMVRITWSGLLGTEQEFDHKRHHPTQKPIELSKWFLDKYSEDGWIIADLFLGSGSTLIACEKTNRVCYGMEIDPKYGDVIIKRWEELTGKKANKLYSEPI